MPKNTVERRIDGRPAVAGVVVSGSSGGGGGGVTDHGALTGLLDDDHPQYLTAARGDALFLTPAEGNALYVPLARQVITGDGMSGGGALSADRTLAVDATVVRTSRQIIAGNGLTGGGTLAADRTLVLGTPSDVSASSTNSVTSTSHAHYVASAADVHLGETVLLQSNAGKLRLKDLEVGPGATPVLVTVSTPNMERVGILMQPDPQFALDIGGPCRAQLFIGPHAIQLKDALLISHFDGASPFESNFTGEPNGHMGQAATLYGGAHFIPGKFGKALATGRATTNLCTNPSFETNTTGWTLADANASATMQRTSLYSRYGGYCLNINNSASNENDYAYADVTVAANTTYTISVWANVLSFGGGAISNYGLFAADTSAGGAQRATLITGVTDGWVRLSVTLTTTATANTIRVRLYAPGGSIVYDAVQVEVGGGATPYCDGSLGSGHTWSGTAHASTSSRTAAYLTYAPAGNINRRSGTAMCWARIDGYSSTALSILLGLGTAGSRTEILVNGAGVLVFSLNGSYCASTYDLVAGDYIGKWVHVAATWDVAENKAQLYLNGQAAASASACAMLAAATTLGVGFADSMGASHLWNGAIDDLAITGRALTANEVRAVYESNAPVFAESSTWSFRATPKGLVWADENGLWVRDANGGAVFGVYGGEYGTKPWGSISLDQGDVLIGDGTAGGGYMQWDDSAATLNIKGNLVAATGTFSGALSAASGTFAGSLTAATGTFAGALSAASGSITGTLAIGAGGSITAGSSVTLSNSGLVLDAPSVFTISAAITFKNATGTIGSIFGNQNGTSGGAVYIESPYRGTTSSTQVRLRAGTSTQAELIVDQTTAGVNSVSITGSLTTSGVLTVPVGSVGAPSIRTPNRATAGLYFTDGGSSAAALVSVAVDGIVQAEIAKGFTKFGGTVVGSTSASASTSAYVYASGQSSQPGFEQTTGGGVRLRTPSGQVVSVIINSNNVFSANETYVDMSVPFRNLRAGNDPGSGVGSTVTLTNVWGGTGSGTITIAGWGTGNQTSVGWWKIWHGTTAYRIPLFQW